MKNILVVSEYFDDAAERYAGIAAEILKYFDGCRLSGLFFTHAGSQVCAGNIPGFDRVFEFSSICDAKVIGNKVNADLLICLLHHNPSMTDMVIYRAARSITAQHHLYTYRSIPLMAQAIHKGVSHNHSIIKGLAAAVKLWVLLHLKITLLSFLVFICAPFLKPARSRNVDDAPSSILVIKLDALGDMIVSMPYFFELKHHFPGSRLTILASSRGSSILKEQKSLLPDLFDELIEWDTPWYSQRHLLGVVDLLNFSKMLSGLRKEQYDLVIQTVPLGVDVALAALISGEKTFSLTHPELPLSRLMERFITNPLPIDPRKIYHMEEFSRIVADSLGMAMPSRRKLAFSEADAVNVAAFAGLEDGLAPVVFNVGAGNRIRKWGSENFAGLAEQVALDGRKVILIGGVGDRATASEILALAPDVSIIDAVGRFSLNEVAALMSASAAIVTADTGVMHLAAAMGSKIVAIFGAGLIPFCHPLSDDYVIVKHELGCSGCGDRCFTSGRPPCLELVSVADVYSALERQLSEAGGNKA